MAGEDAAGWGLLHHAVVLLDYAYFFHGVVDYGGEGGGEVGGGGAFEVVGGSGVIAGEDFAGVVEGHFFQGGEEDLFGLGSGLLGGAVHAGFKFVNSGAHAEHAQVVAYGLEFGWQGYLDGFVFEEAVGLAGGGDGFGGADFKGLLEARNDFVVAEGGDVAVVEGVVGSFEDVASWAAAGREQRARAMVRRVGRMGAPYRVMEGL